jgi:hypothetical protein
VCEGNLKKSRGPYMEKYDINHFNNFLNTINHLNMGWVTYLRMIAYMGHLWPHLGLNFNMYNLIAPKMNGI